MIKKHFQKELLLSGAQSQGGSNTKKEVEKIQSWLNLYELMAPGTGLAIEIRGSSNGNGVYKRIRNFHNTVIDVFSIEALV